MSVSAVSKGLSLSFGRTVPEMLGVREHADEGTAEATWSGPSGSASGAAGLFQRPRGNFSLRHVPQVRPAFTNVRPLAASLLLFR